VHLKRRNDQVDLLKELIEIIDAKADNSFYK
jgi:hypothetical protein